MIYDCFTFYNELDLLEIRLSELWDVVDYFVLVEATQTFQGDPKPLFYLENSKRYERFHAKIIYVICEFPIDLPVLYKEKEKYWLREFYQRDLIIRGIESAKPDDLIIVSDVDEVISAKALSDALRTRKWSELTVFSMPLHLFFLDRQEAHGYV